MIMEPEWVLNDNTRAVMDKVDRMIISVKDVEMVECVKFDHEVTASAEQLDSVEKTLVKLHKEASDAKQG